MPKKRPNDVDLQSGVVSISKAASGLAALIKKSKADEQPIVVPQGGYPTGAIGHVYVIEPLRQLGRQYPEELARVMAENVKTPYLGAQRQRKQAENPLTQKQTRPKAKKALARAVTRSHL